MAGAAVTPIAPWREHAIELAHPFGQIAIRRRDPQMIVIAHQAIRMATPIEVLDHLTEHVKEVFIASLQPHPPDLPCSAG